jgi:hypothetical protein
MPKSGASGQVLTANRLTVGDVVYRDAAGGWTEHFSKAAIFTDADAAKASLEAAVSQDEPARLILDPYLFDVAPDETGAHIPTSERERIRALGPTVRLDLGKQADGDGAAIPA